MLTRDTRVAVFMGGTSQERDVSLESGGGAAGGAATSAAAGGKASAYPTA